MAQSTGCLIFRYFYTALPTPGALLVASVTIADFMTAVDFVAQQLREVSNPSFAGVLAVDRSDTTDSEAHEHSVHLDILATLKFSAREPQRAANLTTIPVTPLTGSLGRTCDID